jgi:hypothetical protein
MPLRHSLPFVLLLMAGPLHAQASSGAPADSGRADAFVDATARTLADRAMRARLETDAAIASYTATVRQRVAAGLRMPLKDRTLFRQESAMRVFWNRDGRNVVELLASREQHPGGVEAPLSVGEIHNPAGDRLHFGFSGSDSEDDWIHHPLAFSGLDHYRYRSGDTLRMAFPGGQRLTVIELQVIPRERTSRAVAGSLWIDEASGALVQAAFRLAREFDLFRDALDDDPDMAGLPGIFRPITADMNLLVIEYSLWHFRHWLPRVMRFEGMAQAGSLLRMPITAEIAYDIHDVRSDAERQPEIATAAADSVIAEWTAAGELTRVRQTGPSRGGMTVLRPADRQSLLASPLLPPPVWADAPEFTTMAELESLRRALDGIQLPGQEHVEWDLAYGWQSTDLMRYNRVEGLSLGVRGTASYDPLVVAATLRLGAADLAPNASLSVRNVSRRYAVAMIADHGLRSVDDEQRALGLGPSLGALLLGRDDGDYYRSSALRMTLEPGTMRRGSWQAWAEVARHRPATKETDWSLPSLWSSRTFRPAIVADEATLARAGVALRPWWGLDPLRAQAGVDARIEGGTGDFHYARASLLLRGALPLTRGHRLGLEVGAGTTEGGAPLQRNFFLGGPATLRGYEGGTAIGSSFGRARAELARGFPGAAMTLFGDVGWAGHRDAIHANDLLYSAGVGASLLDGFLRLDLTRAMRRSPGWRLEIYLDALL